ncbi:MAG: SDR family oxidoreductase [Selenomonadaceae bacterium]|nr:SDR family oxidoreductase [Selenomonadaceae bacterium]
MSEVTFNFSGKNFAVVGASSGMGRQIALELAEAGAHVLAIARNEERLKAVKDQYPELIDYKQLDVTTATDEDWDQVVGEFVKAHGKLNGEVYTSGVTLTVPLKFYYESEAKKLMDVNFWGAVKSLQIMSRKKFAAEGSSYVLFSSTAGAACDKGLAFYAASKSALMAAMRSFCHDLSERRHRVNTISPGWVNTNMTDKALFDEGKHDRLIEHHLLGTGEPDDVSGMVLFLLSNRAKWITGEDFVLDGGALKGAFA